MLTVNFEPFPTLATERLTLRQMKYDDAQDLFAMRSDPEMMKYLDRPLATSVEDAFQLLKKIADSLRDNEGITWGMSLTGDERLIGTIGYWRMVKDHYRAEIGYMVHTDFQGKGLMNEALLTVIDFGFRQLGIHSIEANVNPNNAASIRLLEKMNFEREAYHRENHYYNGKFMDSAIYSLLNKEDRSK